MWVLRGGALFVAKVVCPRTAFFVCGRLIVVAPLGARRWRAAQKRRGNQAPLDQLPLMATEWVAVRGAALGERSSTVNQRPWLARRRPARARSDRGHRRFGAAKRPAYTGGEGHYGICPRRRALQGSRTTRTVPSAGSASPSDERGAEAAARSGNLTVLACCARMPWWRAGELRTPQRPTNAGAMLIIVQWDLRRLVPHAARRAPAHVNHRRRDDLLWRRCWRWRRGGASGVRQLRLPPTDAPWRDTRSPGRRRERTTPSSSLPPSGGSSPPEASPPNAKPSGGGGGGGGVGAAASKGRRRRRRRGGAGAAAGRASRSSLEPNGGARERPRRADADARATAPAPRS